MIYETYSPEETKQIAVNMGINSNVGDIFCLSGDLGVGKTLFSKGFAGGLGIDEREVTSPTFTIINQYNGRLPMYHFDVYRITDIEEMDDTGYEDCFFGEGVCLVEWAEMVKDIIPENAVWILIEKDLEKGENYRKITIRGENIWLY